MYLKEVGGLYSDTPISSTSIAAHILQENFQDADREYFIALYLNGRGIPISYHIVGIGDVNCVHFSIASVFKMALLQNAVTVILCHNHPSGNLGPSKEDIDTTEQLISAGRLIGIEVIDHFILSPYSYISMREEYGHMFKK